MVRENEDCEPPTEGCGADCKVIHGYYATLVGMLPDGSKNVSLARCSVECDGCIGGTAADCVECAENYTKSQQSERCVPVPIPVNVTEPKPSPTNNTPAENSTHDAPLPTNQTSSNVSTSNATTSDAPIASNKQAVTAFVATKYSFSLANPRVALQP